MNCVVGRNGSGKSNLFDAVQFVLGCPKFWSLRTVSFMYIYTCIVIVSCFVGWRMNGAIGGVMFASSLISSLLYGELDDVMFLGRVM